MRNFIALILLYFIRFTLWFRYRVTIKGIENLNPEQLSKSGGVLFLPNHPAIFVDPTLITVSIWRKYPIRPMVIEYMYYTPVIHWFMSFVNALPVPNFMTSSNSLKKKRADRVIDEVITGLKQGDNFMVYPAGKIKHTGYEFIGGASAAHRIIESAPEANVVLVRTTGLWGSSFSRALIGKSPPMFATIWQGVKIALKNLLFFTPRREVTIEFTPAGPDFPYKGSRLEINQYLEKWYNRPSQVIPTDTTTNEPGESLYLVSYSMWSEDLPKIQAEKSAKTELDVSHVPLTIQTKIKEKLAEMTHISIDQIRPEMELASELGLDSLDNAELLAFLDDNYDVSGVPVAELTTVGKLMALATKQVVFGEKVEEEIKDLSRWNQSSRPQASISMPEGETIPEVFLNTCDKMGNAVACGDMMAGILTYSQAKMRVILLAHYIKNLPGDYIGVLLPSSVAAYLTVLACQLAGKTPLMINWTVGPRHLESVIALSKVQVVISSWAFLDRLENVNLNGVEDLIVTLEEIRRDFSLFDKMKAFYQSKKGAASLLSSFQNQRKTKDSAAVLLFTSGTESMPKGVPLTHENVLSNQRDIVKAIDIDSNDVLLGILPPFHAFGFTISGLLPLLAGIRVAYSPDPTDGKGLAKAIERWSATMICGAPSFLKGIFKNGNRDQLKTLRLGVTGAEKAPPELFQMIRELGHCSLIEGYGITECSPVLTINREGDSKKGVGVAMPSVKLCIVDLDKHQPLKKGEQGLILAKGPNIFTGYLNGGGLTSPFLTINDENWYSTGDLGYLDPEENLILSGRLKRFIKVGAEMVSLAAIEDALQHTIGLEKGKQIEEGPLLAVCAKEEVGERPRIFVFTRFPTTIDEVNKCLKEAGFSNLVKVFKVQQLAEIPLMGSGKINYRALESSLAALNNHNQQELSKVST